MADEKKNGNGKGMVCDCMSGCGCACHGSGGKHWTFFLLRTLLTILILMFVFWFGVMASRVGGSYNARYMMMRGGDMSGMGAMPMMQVNGATSSPTTGGVQNY